MKKASRRLHKKPFRLMLEQLEDRNAPSDSLSAILLSAGLNVPEADDFAASQVASFDRSTFGTTDDPLGALSLAPVSLPETIAFLAA